MHDRPGTLDPATVSPLPDVAWSDPTEVGAAVARARAAQAAWAGVPMAEREKACLALGRRILERRDEICALLSSETGRDPVDSLFSEVVFQLTYVKSAIQVARAALAPEKVRLSALDWPGKRAVIEAVPRGVIAIIEPWNYPLLQFVKPLYPALLSGNAVVLKPSEHTPRTGRWLAEQCAAIFPPELVQIVVGDGAVGSALLEADIDAVVFCGSVGTGRKVAARCGERLLPCSLELGGKDAALVLADCDLERTVAGVLQWSMHNAGQDCSSIERVYVEDAVADAFVERLGRAAGRLKVAPQPDHADLGPLQNPAQLRLVGEHVQDAVALGAVVVTGGEPTGAGLGYRPTVLDRCDERMKAVRDETFGPVVAIVRCKDAEEAVRRANDSRYGLLGSVWTKDLARGEALARRLQVGVALVNNHSFPGSIPQIPWTGVKDSGSGVAASRHAYPTFVRRRTIVVDKSKDPDVFWRPIDGSLKALGEAAAELALGAFTRVFTLLGLLGKRTKAIRENVR
jgi:acyl-CoA reductase-like NAD-dependent aldehyde dehydrogenase